MSQILLPSLGESVDKGTVVSILVNTGDKVSIDQPLMEVETDKVTAEVPCEMEGIVDAILVNIGDEIGEGTPILKIKSDGAKEEEVPDLEIEVKETEIVEEDNDEIQVNIQSEIIETVKSSPVVSNVVITSNPEVKKGYRASPLAKKLAKEIGIDLSQIQTSNQTGRISMKDVKNYAKKINQGSIGGGMQGIVTPLPDFSKWGEIDVVPMKGIMKATSRNMVNAWSQIPHAWLQEKADITEIESKRQKYKAEVRERGGSLTITAILVSVVAKALAEFPEFNASVDATSGSIINKKYIHIGVAVDTERGLLVPKIENADQLKISDIALALGQISEKARSNKLGIEELEGGTFTISNLGGIGTTSIFPIVNHPQVAILGIAASKLEPVWNGDSFEPRLMMPLTIGFDHRIINGADAARFLQRIKMLLEDTFLWSL